GHRRREARRPARGLAQPAEQSLPRLLRGTGRARRDARGARGRAARAHLSGSAAALAAFPALELLAELHAAAMDPALRGGERDLQHAGDLLVREPLEVAQDDRRSVLD